MREKISVIVPIYNAETYLPQCIDSILTQDYRNFELILVNDGSTDTSGEICEHYAGQDSRIRVITQANGGVSKARNAGLDVAVGKYVSFIDADDWVDPDYLSILLKHMDKGGLSFCEWRRQPVRQRVGGVIRTMDQEETMRFVLDLSGVHGCPFCKLFDKELILKHHLRFAEDIVYCEDILFTICYCSVSEGQISATNQDAYYYRNNPDSVSNTQVSKCAGELPKGIFSNYEAFSRCKKYAVSENVARLCELHMARSAVTTLRLMEINKIKRVPFGTYGELRRYVSRYCVQYLFCSSATKASKFSLFLSALSPKLEVLVWRQYHSLKLYRLRRKNLCR